MLFGIPWYGIVGIISVVVPVVGGMIYAYKIEQMKMQNQVTEKSTELEELRKMFSHLKARLENLEAIAASSPEDLANNEDIGSIEIVDGYDNASNENQKEVSKIANDLRTK